MPLAAPAVIMAAGAARSYFQTKKILTMGWTTTRNIMKAMMTTTTITITIPTIRIMNQRRRSMIQTYSDYTYETIDSDDDDDDNGTAKRGGAWCGSNNRDHNKSSTTRQQEDNMFDDDNDDD
jgi:hypothetical protein